MKTLAFLFLALTLAGQSDWSGSWKGAELTLTIQGKGPAYGGTITLEGRALQFTAQASGDRLEGSFTVEGAKFPFTVTRAGGGHVKLVSDGSEYLLAPANAPRNPLAGMAPSAAGNSIIGDWQGPQGPVRFGADLALVLAGQNYRYQVEGSTVLLIAADGRVPVPFQLQGDTMTLGVGPQAIRLTRSGGAARAPGAAGKGGVLPELVGKWCYQANVYATSGGGRSSSQCFVLNADGTYEYSGLTDSYNPNGGATSESYDAGTWTATETTITANSRSKGSTTYRLEKRNHPKNVNDPMLVLDGQAFVTAWQKAPWR